MEERALYRAILAAPHDDALRLAYADWLDEHADTLPQPAAERGRAAFIRAQCETARATPAGWHAGRGPGLTTRERRLLFHHGKKWRRAFPARNASAPFDRGFLRPLRSLTPQQFLGHPPNTGLYQPFPPLPVGSPVWRYINESEDGALASCPLWDVHLYAPGWLNDPNADQGQYGELLAEVARSPALKQIGWLKVSFVRTSVFEFLRAGDFSNVETLVLNSGPFPDVLRTVAENESFRSLRYVQFGSDLWAWAPTYVDRIRYYTLQAKLREVNERHPPFGTMRGAIANVLRDTPVPPPFVPPPPVIPQPVVWPTAPAQQEDNAAGAAWGVGVVLFLALLAVRLSDSKPVPRAPTFQPITIPEHKMPDFKLLEYKPVLPQPPKYPFSYEPDPLKRAKRDAEVEELLKKLRAEHPDLNWRPLRPPDEKQRPPLAPPPRAVERPPPSDADPDEK